MAVRRFLVVDDDCDDSELFTEAVESVDASVSCLNALDGREALNRLYNHQLEKPDLIFLDINMPVMNGWQFLSSLKGSDGLKEIPVIMYSTSTDRLAIKKALSSGAICFFTKPNNFQLLKSILRIVLEYMDKGLLDEVCPAIQQYKAPR